VKSNRQSREFDNFDRTMRDLMNVPHDEIKRELDAEKAAKARKKRKVKEPSAEDRDADKTD